ncbi:uncharacterized protein G6M90_00g078890 [Metarhizium brunneum]|uniref:Uncharacterized protein n=1 Tax=Metarhizium brunneum TaxID=500148 RepID=A0A7D5V1C0_9HYPO
MASFFHDPRRPALSQVVEALQRLQNDPQQLAHEREGRYDDPPPPYPESGETTQPPTPGPPVVDETYQRELRRKARYKATPVNQFNSQANRELERLVHQLSEKRFGRRQTLPWDGSSDLRANSENNVRSRWVEQGIWGNEWGPAWPEDSHPMSKRWQQEGDGPFFGSYSSSTSKSLPGARWGHEEPDPEPESESESEQERPPIFGIFGLGVGQPKRSKSPQRFRYIQTEQGQRLYIPNPTVRNPEASRPYNQFLYQISKERDWIKDELDYKALGTSVDIDTIVYQSVKDMWIEDGIWNPKWGELPGMTWIYEEPEEEEAVEAPASPDAVAGQHEDAIDDGRQHAPVPRTLSIFGQALISNMASGGTDGSSAPALGDAGASTTDRRTGTREAPSDQTAVTHDVQDPGDRPRRAARIERPPREERTPRLRKRSRGSDAVVDEQPPKRPRRSTRLSALPHNASDSADANKPHGSKTVDTSGVEEGRRPPCDKRAAPASGKTKGKKVNAVANPVRRSARIAERERKRMADMAEELPSKSRSPRAKTTRTARRK